jgi:hypothetical protein
MGVQSAHETSRTCARCAWPALNVRLVSGWSLSHPNNRCCVACVSQIRSPERRTLVSKLGAAVVVGLLLLTQSATAQSTKPVTPGTLASQTIHRRAVDAVIWGVPLVSFDSRAAGILPRRQGQVQRHHLVAQAADELDEAARAGIRARGHSPPCRQVPDVRTPGSSWR